MTIKLYVYPGKVSVVSMGNIEIEVNFFPSPNKADNDISCPSVVILELGSKLIFCSIKRPGKITNCNLKFFP